jgi:hypothetical protein
VQTNSEGLTLGLIRVLMSKTRALSNLRLNIINIERPLFLPMDSLVKRGDVSRTAPTTRSRSAGSPCCSTTATSPRRCHMLNGTRMEKRVLSQPISRDIRLSRSPVMTKSFAAYGDSLFSPDNGLDLASQLASSAILTGVAAALAYFLSMREAAYQVRKTLRLPRIFVSRQIFPPLTPLS